MLAKCLENERLSSVKMLAQLILYIQNIYYRAEPNEYNNHRCRGVCGRYTWSSRCFDIRLRLGH